MSGFVSTVNVRIAVVIVSDLMVDSEVMLGYGAVSDSYGYRNQYNI